MRKVLYISGTRADYGPARRLLLKINEHPEFELGILVTGMHLDPSHGETWAEIEKDVTSSPGVLPVVSFIAILLPYEMAACITFPVFPIVIAGPIRAVD